MQESSSCAGHSSGRTRTDFSIARILGTSKSLRAPPQEDAPQWLACSRYHPPRIPRNWTRSSTSTSRRPGRHARIPFTAVQARALESAFTRARYLSQPELRTLAAALQLRDDRIKIWFQNRRARERREKAITVYSSNSSTTSPVARPETTEDIHERCGTPVDIETIEDDEPQHENHSINPLLFCKSSYIHIQEQTHIKTFSPTPD